MYIVPYMWHWSFENVSHYLFFMYFLYLYFMDTVVKKNEITDTHKTLGTKNVISWYGKLWNTALHINQLCRWGTMSLAFLGKLGTFSVNTFPSNADLGFFHSQPLLHYLSTNVSWGRLCLVVIASSSLLILNSAWLYDVWTLENPYFHLDWPIYKF